MVVINKRRGFLVALSVVTVVAVILVTGFSLSTMTGSRSYALPANERAAWMRIIKARKERQDPDRPYVKLAQDFFVGKVALTASAGSSAAPAGGLRDPSRFNEAALFISDPAYLYWVTAGQGASSDPDEDMYGRVQDLVHDVHLAVLRHTRESPERRYSMTVVAQIVALDRVFTRCLATDMTHDIQRLGNDLLGPALPDADLVEGFWIGHEAAHIHLASAPCSKG